METFVPLGRILTDCVNSKSLEFIIISSNDITMNFINIRVGSGKFGDIFVRKQRRRRKRKMIGEKRRNGRKVNFICRILSMYICSCTWLANE